MRKTTEQFIEEAKLIHGDKYDYSLVDYVNNRTKVNIMCKVHGAFSQTPNDHLRTNGCDKCGQLKSKDSQRSNSLTFIEKAKIIHGDKYDYSLVDYVNNITPVIIICPIHGEFSQRPSSHTNANCGCQKCNSSKGELKIRKILEDNKIEFIPQHRFDDCKGRRVRLPFDFYLPTYNAIIEFDGKQHYKGWKGCKESLKKIQLTDSIKTEYCNKSNILLIRIAYNESIEDKLQPILHKKILEVPLSNLGT